MTQTAQDHQGHHVLDVGFSAHRLDIRVGDAGVIAVAIKNRTDGGLSLRPEKLSHHYSGDRQYKSEAGSGVLVPECSGCLSLVAEL